MEKYVIGLDYGTLSARALLLNVRTGEELGSISSDYEHAVMYDTLPKGAKLGYDWALQDAQDYLDVLEEIVPKLLSEYEVSGEDVIGLGVDFTSSTIMPVTREGKPLSFLEEYENRPHAYVKLWKHHAAQDYANEINDLANSLGESWIKRYGGKISSEWMFPKALQVLREDEEIYQRADRFIEGGDWLVWMLTGKEVRSSCQAGYKGIWHKQEGYPSKDFLKKLDPRFENFVDEKLQKDIRPLGERAGGLTKDMAERLGLSEGTAVAVAVIDAHVTMPALDLVEPSKMLAIIGTSTCHIMVSDIEENVEGISGVVEDGVIPGYYGYEAGQACVGDGFYWYVNNFVPKAYFDQASEAGMQIQEFLTEKASKQLPGEHGLVALDWWNGNRSTLVDADLTGIIVGMTIHTRPEDVYRALLEATAFGTKVIVDTFNDSRVEVKEFYASGGIPNKNALMMQIYADVLNMPVHVTNIKEGPALGSAIFGALAAGQENGGYDTIYEAAKKLGKTDMKVYHPIEENVKVYSKLYDEYLRLYNYFGKGENQVMKRLRNIRED